MNVSDLTLFFLSYVLEIQNTSMDLQRLRNYSEHLDTSNNYKECGFPKHTPDDNILHIPLLKPRKDTFNTLNCIAPRNSWEKMNLSH